MPDYGSDFPGVEPGITFQSGPVIGSAWKVLLIDATGTKQPDYFIEKRPNGQIHCGYPGVVDSLCESKNKARAVVIAKFEEREIKEA